MSYLASLRTKLPAIMAPGRALICGVAILLLAGLAWWLWPLGSGSVATQAGVQPSALRPVAQRIATGPPTPKLKITEVRQTGQIVEVKGTAECDAAVMINGERVPLIFENCGFKHFLVLPEGPSTVAVTAQGPAGGVNTQLLKVTVE
jgi:hypothetical protein